MSGESDESGNEIFLTQTNFSQINTDYDSDTILDGLLDLLEEKSHHGGIMAQQCCARSKMQRSVDIIVLTRDASGRGNNEPVIN